MDSPLMFLHAPQLQHSPTAKRSSPKSGSVRCSRHPMSDCACTQLYVVEVDQEAADVTVSIGAHFPEAPDTPPQPLVSRVTPYQVLCPVLDEGSSSNVPLVVDAANDRCRHAALWTPRQHQRFLPYSMPPRTESFSSSCSFFTTEAHSTRSSSSRVHRPLDSEQELDAGSAQLICYASPERRPFDATGVCTPKSAVIDVLRTPIGKSFRIAAAVDCPGAPRKQRIPRVMRGRANLRRSLRPLDFDQHVACGVS
eukprot:TRINITY_DN3183_c0_g1_i2.p1 TRINITY_DN3183_c0_g1~~TRINITY_DN3183_c0_g1_i2.p1  ORF type:complete len:284 (+),score=-18.22 TRINITY_DN3183_c0_g1_i2:96-854(+)